jgi:hypothetical protein
MLNADYGECGGYLDAAAFSVAQTGDMPVNKHGISTAADRSRLSNDTRSLLRSRWVRGMLVGVAALQGVAVAVGKAGYQERPNPLEGGATLGSVAMNLAPVVVAKPIRVAVQVRKPAAKPKAEPRLASAEKLAEKYRRKGFEVSPRLARLIVEAAVDNRIDPEIAFGLVKTESGFKDRATSHVGAIGLTQLMPATARWLKPGVTAGQLRDSETNLRIGFRYLRDLLDKYDGNAELALTAYNRGPGTVDRVLRRGGDPDNGYYGMVMGWRNSHR